MGVQTTLQNRFDTEERGAMFSVFCKGPSSMSVSETVKVRGREKAARGKVRE